jgi:hypothetical protein
MKILINHIGYERNEAKTVVLESRTGPLPESGIAAELLDEADGRSVFSLRQTSSGAVEGWKGRWFAAFDFSAFTSYGTYRVRIALEGKRLESVPFRIAEELLPDLCISDILFYFKGQRSSGRWDLADRTAPFYGGREGTADVHGGWFDAAGDFSKYLSHLSYADFVNPQQIPMVVWALFSLSDTLGAHPRHGGSLLEERTLEEAWWGADFLVRMQDPEGYFYTTLFDQWNKKSEDRMICSFRTQKGDRMEGYQAGFRQGGGVSIAALAKAYRYVRRNIPEDGFTPEEFLERAVAGYDYLKKHNREYLDNGRENIIDYYCALLAAVELYRSTGDEYYLGESREWKAKLLSLFSGEQACWMTEEGSSRPFFHASESGLPLLALIHCLDIESDEARKGELGKSIRGICAAELARTEETYNPFRLSRQVVQPLGGEVRSSFFIPHDNETGYWWQGENARLASVACAFRAAAGIFGEHPETPEDADMAERMREQAVSQLDWILGLNPFDMCMLQGHGRNNPKYEDHYPNAPGGICNGITGGYLDEADIDFLPSAVEGRGDHRWRWSEQWIPHAAWFLLALSAGMKR